MRERPRWEGERERKGRDQEELFPTSKPKTRSRWLEFFFKGVGFFFEYLLVRKQNNSRNFIFIKVENSRIIIILIFFLCK